MNLGEILMEHLIDLAWRNQCVSLPNPAVASAVVKDGKVLSFGIHKIAGSPHAEIIALQNAFAILSGNRAILELKDSNAIHHFLRQNHNRIFNDCELFVTLEPCNHTGKTPPCAELLAELNLSKITFGAFDTFGDSAGGGAALKNATGGVLERHCQDLLLPFLRLKNNGRFTLFKLSMRLNGDYKNGKISAPDSLVFFHNQRAACNNIIISGKTLRSDNPLLDTRFKSVESSKLPNIIIFTRDKNLELKNFNIASRSVSVTDSVEGLKNLTGFNIIEGGWELFFVLREVIDLTLINFTPTLKKQHFSTQIPSDLDLKLLRAVRNKNEVSLWLV